ISKKNCSQIKICEFFLKNIKKKITNIEKISTNLMFFDRTFCRKIIKNRTKRNKMQKNSERIILKILKLFTIIVMDKTGNYKKTK
ncbi:MAG: hypothetical protein KZY55_04365, partial [Paeniclostridium sp.]